MEHLLQLLENYRRSPGDEKAAEEILRIVAPKMSLFLLPRLPEHAVEDLRQKILIAIALGLGGFKGKSASEFWSWCYQIARNKVSDHFRGDWDRTVTLDHERLVRLIDASAHVDALTETDRGELEEAIELLKSRDPDCLELLWKRFILDLDYKEIAAEIGATYDTVRMRITRCLDRARGFLDKN